MRLIRKVSDGSDTTHDVDWVGRVLSVFDGHGDGGHASDYVASTFMIRIVVNVGSARSRVMHASLR